MLNENQVSIDQKVKQFKEFILFCKQQYGLKSLPKFKWFTHSNVGQEQPTFGVFQNEDKTISIGINNRHPLDIMRTIAHELWHYKQLLNQELGNNSGETGSPQENAANAQAGIIMRNWNKLHPEMFAQSPVEKLEESVANELPNEVFDFIDTLSSDDVGKERIGDYVVHYEGFSDVCQADAEERTQLSPNDPRYLACYEDIYKEVLNDFIDREGGAEPVSAGLSGDELYPVYYAVFHRPTLDESQLQHIDQEVDGGSLTGYVVSTDEPQLRNYLTSQGASEDLVNALAAKYHTIAILRNMWVDEELRSGGLGSEMLESAISQAFAYGAEAVILVADLAEDNTAMGKPLDKWYETWGFHTVGTASGDPVMVLDRSINESWSKKYKKSIDCSHPKGFSQKAHCAGRRARQAGKHTKSKSINEARAAFLAYAKSKFPRMPEYVVYELIYKNSKQYPESVTGIWTRYYGSYNWKLVNSFKVNENMWDRETLERISRGMKTDNSDLYPKDKERFIKQREMIQRRGVSQEPIIVEESREEPGKYTLLEGMHRTVEAMRANPQGYTCPAYVGSPTSTTEKIRAKAPDSFWQKLKKRVLGENFADGKGPGKPGDSQRHGIPKGATIAQLEKAAKAPGRKGQLARWQLNMRRGRAKNESVINEGVTVYHSSSTGTIDKFKPFSHFGTEKAAADRIKFLIKQKKLAKDASVTVYKIDLNIHKPALIKDAAVQHDSTQYAFALKDAKIFNQEEMMSITGKKALMPGGWDQAAYDQTEKESLEKLAQMLKEKGYDGLAYKNKYEDKGSMSYVILDPTQARVVGKETIPAQELISSVDSIQPKTQKLEEYTEDNAIPIIKKIRDIKGVDSIWVKEIKGSKGIQRTVLIAISPDIIGIAKAKLEMNLKDLTKSSTSTSYIIRQASYSKAKAFASENGYKLVYKTGPASTYIKLKDIMPDGELVVSKHFQERVGERVLDLDWLLSNIKKAVNKYSQKIKDLSDTAFIIQDEIAGVAIVKNIRVDGSVIYTISTTHGGKIKHGANQLVLWVGNSKLAENSISEIMTISTPSFDKNHVINLMNVAHKTNYRINGYIVYTVYDAKTLMVILYDQTSNDVCACAGFESQQHVRSDLWTARNAASFAPYNGQNLIAKIYRYCKEQLDMTIQSDMFQSGGAKRIWTKGLQKLGLNPKIYDSRTHRVVDINPNMVYGNTRYQWILESSDIYRNQLSENSILMPYDSLYLNKSNKTNKSLKNFEKTLLTIPLINENDKLDKPTPTVGELAEKYHTSLLAVKQQLAKGIKVEMEHTTKLKVAREIALDHLGEDLYYYKKLAKIEKTK